MSDLVIRCIRHSESSANAGYATNSPASLSLTQLGFEQASSLAKEIQEAPDLIIVSSYLRTYQTATPTIDRFPEVCVVQWEDIREFTYLTPANYSNTTAMERRPFVEEYWRRGDPKFIDGEGAESFDNFIHRINASIRMMESLHAEGMKNVFLYGHGLFLAAMKQIILEGGEVVDMQTVKSLGGSINNGEGYLATFDSKSWSIDGGLK